jgi:REP element-mobilizing transposase RayT
MASLDKIDFGGYYHIYNRGNNGDTIFFDEENYGYFFSLYLKYIYPIADTFCWCLLKNHFHFLIRIKELDEIELEQLSYSKQITVSKDKVNPSGQFSHLFNACTQAINKKYHRTGSVFEKPFQRKIIATQDYFIKLIFYIHNNPVHHGLVKNISDYKWSSYHSIVSSKPTYLLRNEVIDRFDDLKNFKMYHSKNHDYKEIESLILE